MEVIHAQILGIVWSLAKLKIYFAIDFKRVATHLCYNFFLLKYLNVKHKSCKKSFLSGFSILHFYLSRKVMIFFLLSWIKELSWMTETKFLLNFFFYVRGKKETKCFQNFYVILYLFSYFMNLKRYNCNLLM